MASIIRMTGMVIKSMQIGEFDKRITILTTQYGKIGAFARGAKRPGNSLMAATEPFAFGEFEVIEGRTSYTVVSAGISNFFEELRGDFEASCYGFYFLEFADYYGRENADDKEMLRLLYQSVRALCSKALNNRLIRCVYEIKIMSVNGEGAPEKDRLRLSAAAAYTVGFVIAAPVEKLYTFTVTEKVLSELEAYCRKNISMTVDRHFKSLDILENITV